MTPWILAGVIVGLTTVDEVYCPDACPPVCVTYYIRDTEKCDDRHYYMKIGNGAAVCICSDPPKKESKEHLMPWETRYEEAEETAAR